RRLARRQWPARTRRIHPRSMRARQTARGRSAPPRPSAPRGAPPGPPPRRLVAGPAPLGARRGSLRLPPRLRGRAERHGQCLPSHGAGAVGGNAPGGRAPAPGDALLSRITGRLALGATAALAPTAEERDPHAGNEATGVLAAPGQPD